MKQTIIISIIILITLTILKNKLAKKFFVGLLTTFVIFSYTIPTYAMEEEAEVVEVEETTLDEVVMEDPIVEEVPELVVEEQQEEIIDTEDDYKEFEEEQEKRDFDFEIDEAYVNPLYADVISESDLAYPTERSSYRKLDSTPSFNDVYGAGAYVRQQMKNRVTEVSYRYDFPETLVTTTVNAYATQFSKDVIAQAFLHTGVAQEGDNIRWQYGGYRASISGDLFKGEYSILFTYTFTYYTTVAQEQQVASKITQVLNTLNIWNKTPYQKIQSIYNWLCQNVTYDYSSGDDLTRYTSYGALIKGTCVCQGYANALYALANAAGVDCRMITGVGNSAPHAWNIVHLDGLYYNLDATWDAGRSTKKYFLVGDGEFGLTHSRSSEYMAELFMDSYPVSYNNYDPNSLVPLISIKIDQGNIERARGARGQLTVTYNPDNTSEGKHVTWTSSDEKVVKIDAYGKFECLSVGTATIKAKSITGKTDQITITVKEKPYTVAFENPNATVEMHRTIDVLPKASEIDVYPAFTWKSSNTNVATVEDGTITGVSKGTATITATAENGTSCTLRVTVVDLPIDEIVINEGNQLKVRDQQGTLSVSVYPEDATISRNITWTSNKPDIVSIDQNGTYTCKGVGDAIITATSVNGKVDQVTVTSSEKYFQVFMNQSSFELYVGKTFQLAPYTSVSDIKPTYKYTTGNASIATVDQNGLVTAKAPGVVYITATAPNGQYASSKVTVKNAEIMYITITGSDTNRNLGDSGRLTAVTEPAEITGDKSITWTSTKPEVVTVDQNGNFQCVGQGECTIFAEAKNGVYGSLKFKVTDPNYTISLNKSSASINAGGYVQLKCYISNTAISPTITWTSSDESIATVNANGKVVGVSRGVVTITASAPNGCKVTSTITVNQADVYVTSVTLNKDSISGYAGETGKLTATCFPVNANTGKEITWASSNTSVVSVDQSGNYTFLKPGTALITATSSNNKVTSCSVTVLEKPYTISLNKSELSLVVGKAENLSVNFSEETSNTNITWTSSNTAVATVTAGRVKAVKEGTATITAKASNGTKATCQVTVIASEVYVSQVTVSTNQVTGYIGDKGSVSATCLPTNATSGTGITWSTTNASVVSVDQNGNYTLLKAGTATLQATSSNGKVGYVSVTVNEKPYSISLNKTSLSLPVTKSQQLEVSFSETPSNTTISWTSSEPTVATVVNGLVKAYAKGQTTITAKAANGMKVTCVVTVTDLEISAVKITSNEFTRTLGATGTLTATVTPTNTTMSKAITWVSSNPDIVSIDNDGKYSCNGYGDATITATSVNGKQHSAIIHVVRTVVENGWYTDEDGNSYYYENKKEVTGWKAISGKWYYFNEKGVMAVGAQMIENDFYVLSDQGVMLTGWQKVDNDWYYTDASGKCLLGWQKVGTKWYYFTEEYKMAVGLQTIGDVKFFFNDNGTLFSTGWLKVDGTWYYFLSTGAVKGWKKINNVWYYFDDEYQMANGKCSIDGVVYNFKSSGAQITGWLEESNGWHYYKTTGEQYGWQSINSKWYYFDEAGVMVKGVQEIDGVIYNMTTGAKATSASWYKNTDGTYYYFQANGKAASGWLKVGTKWYYFDLDTKIMLHDETREIDGVTYIFASNGTYTKA